MALLVSTTHFLTRVWAEFLCVQGHDLQTGSESRNETHANLDRKDWEFLQGRDAEDTSEHTFGGHTNLTVHIPFSSMVNCSNRPDFKALISHSLTTDECISLITKIFSECIRPRVGSSLSKADYQTIVDIIYEASAYLLLPSREA